MKIFGGDLVIREHVKSLGQSFIYAVIVFILLYIFLWPVRIVGVSMSPTLNDGDRVFVSRGMGFVSEYTHGDLVMVRINDDIGSRYIIKRIAAVPGDVLIIDNGQVTINGVIAPFRYERHGEDSLRFELYQDHYFLIGDNHTFSTDSRDFGPLHRNDLRGRVLFRFMGGSFTIN